MIDKIRILLTHRNKKKKKMNIFTVRHIHMDTIYQFVYTAIRCCN